ncbi:MAG: hypothetical protein K2R93_14030 [Gemmatimonadaceae bacterium]|nr:hypothetical protein [Gemmatimonadaceae bacterium]
MSSRAAVLSLLLGLTPVLAHPALAQVVGTAPRTVRWTVRTLPHLDLWLHGFALLSNDSAQAPTVPLYLRGYRDSVSAVRRRANVLSALDGNQAALVEGLGKGGGYTSAQFVPFEYASWDALRRSAELFGQVKGDLNRAPSREAQQELVPLAAVFRTGSDREWLRLFLAALTDERMRWFDAEAARVATARRDVVDAVDRLWQQQAPRFERFLTNSGQRQGELVLSLPIGAEGRTTTTAATTNAPSRTMIAVPFPARAEDAAQALYVFAHEITGTMVGPVVSDNVTPAETRSGAAARYTSLAQVLAGAMLLERVAPELRPGYQRYYLTQVGVRVSANADAAALFAQTFSLPTALRDALAKQLDLILGGI